MKRLMVLGASPLQVPIIECAQEMGLEVIALDMNPDSIGFKIPNVICEIISTNDTEKVLECARKYDIAGIVTNSDYPVNTVAKVNKELGLAGISEECAFIATNKAELRKKLKEYDIPSPRFFPIFTLDDLFEAVQKMGERCILKAVDNAGSRGIKLIENITDRDALIKAFDYCKESSRCGELVLEEVMEGPEVCVETLNFDGTCFPVQITDQLAKKPPFYTDAGYSQPTILSDEVVNRIKEVAVAANVAIGNICGSSCTEIIVTKDGPKIVEIGARLAGDYMTSHMVPLSNGVDMVKGMIQIALGEKPDITPKFSKGSAVRYYMEPVTGIIKEIKGIEEARNSKGVTDVFTFAEVGDVARELHGSSDRLAVVIATDNSPEEAVKDCENALAKIKFITD